MPVFLPPRSRWIVCSGWLGAAALLLGCQGGPEVSSPNQPNMVAAEAIEAIGFTEAATEPAEQDVSLASLSRLVESAIWPTRPGWRSWGDQHLQTGDLVFIRSNYRILLGTFNLSRFLSEVADSPFSHVGLVVIEQGRPRVYDASDKGITGQPFESFVTKGKIERVAIRRPARELQQAIPAAVAYVQKHQQLNTPFDDRFEIGEEKLYCTELIIRAFEAGNVSLAEPLPVARLPGLEEVDPVTLRLARWATRLDDDDLIWLPGNAQHGLYGAAGLQTVLEPTDSPPAMLPTVPPAD